ncbi:MAG: ABC transporter permease [Rhodobacterales bacterium]|jgi:rhamnose transport system permease protein|nr:MAG: ABC transporter permease [Rhodobacterales bacterium]|tara:strand:- start:2447 stop:3391 length:945 start_codon:yes stop_codon:yes gene_type:complete
MRMKSIFRHETILFLVVIVALVILSIQAEQFATIDNLLNQGRFLTEVSLVALIMTFVIVTGGIDLSVGSILGLSAIVLGVAWKKLGLPLPLAILVALSVGTLAGLFNGIIITRFKVPPLIATLATLALYRGLAEGISQARSIRGYPEWFFILGQGEFFGIPTQLWIVAFFTLLTGFILTYTTWGRATYAIGANETAARFSGIAVDKTKLFIYAASGFAASLAAIIFVSRVSTTRSDMGMGLELDAITAVVLGGTSIFGGKGTIVGTFFGLILIQILKNGLSLAGVKSDGTYIAIGLVLILTLLISNLFNRNSEG